MPAELAPFLAKAVGRLEADTDGLQPDEAIRHLETTLARTEIEASRLGIRMDMGQPATELPGMGDNDDGGSVVVIQRLVDDE
ncbi:MAG TPA: hypothetical protein VIL36_00770 [Acidimicrobiales bacterium]